MHVTHQHPGGCYRARDSALGLMSSHAGIVHQQPQQNQAGTTTGQRPQESQPESQTAQQVTDPFYGPLIIGNNAINNCLLADKKYPELGDILSRKISAHNCS